MIKELVIIIIFLVFVSKGALGMSIFGSDFQRNYRALFNNVEKLNEYTKTHKVELSGEKITDINIEGAEFYGAKFTKVKWVNVCLEKGVFVDVIFRNCEFLNSKMNAAQFKDCVFENCKIEYTQINRAKFINGKFIDCDIANSGMVKWAGDSVAFTGGRILDTPLAQGNIEISFRNTALDGVRMMMNEGSHRLLIEGGLLSEVDFGKSHFSDVILRRVKQGEGGIKFNSIRAANIRLENVELDGIGFMEAHAKSAIIVDSVVLAIGFSGGGVGKIIFRDSTVQYFDIAESMMPHVEFNSCRLIEPMLYDGLIKEFAIRDSSINNITGNGFKADIVEWDNVVLDGKIDLTNAQIKDFRPTRLKRGPRLQLITTGSNIQF